MPVEQAERYLLRSLRLAFEIKRVPLNSERTVLQDLLTRVANADKNAFSELYGLMSARLLGIQIRILKDKELAEDALQETFLKVWNNASQFDGDKASPVVWLNSLARNQALDHLRRIRTRSNVSVVLSAQNPDDWPIDNREIHDDIADNQRLTFCLDRLDVDSQRCIVGVYCEGFTQDELSTSLDRPLGTVKSWIRRGLLSLKECLDELS
ncbi:MAG: sigma-70 family RNA polymerase sigma factor [Gammaproteobacteria bacterium]|nr:sigma-70 family RNA polymerase sigma factor [Gammaproteobacteria bacterium]